ncbi:endonuclease/exonuclease/phosphatase family protein [Phaeobacter marinintestinus]|uniref:endonuclease/exonuclease/phosphatase family protein n=1 Tax=Falsiphaeobacter marinintestinus TaxID=1492905 RepID=UPI0011B83F5F|nr:endonuclease/exonuclease/phosphatase family protein [Phaeobacter marinintestinus]
MIQLRVAAVLILLSIAPTYADSVRIATFNVELQRAGPGLLLRDILKGKDSQINAAANVIVRNRPDILALQGFDWDYDTVALKAFNTRLKADGHGFAHLLALQPNSGFATDLDLNEDGRLGHAADAQGFGEFTGQGGIAVLSRFPIDVGGVQDFSDVLWRDLPEALLPETPVKTPFPSEDALAIQRLSSTGHWAVPIQIAKDQHITLLTFQAGPPVFDGPEDRNGRRNHDEVLFWRHFLDGHIGTPPAGPFVLAGGANQDPHDGDGLHNAIRSLIEDPRLQDPRPDSLGASMAPDQGHAGPNALDTVDWPGPGRMRVDHILPSAHWTVTDAGVFWPAPDNPDSAMALDASRHRLVWVDLRLDK